jgi:hypothetical protein
MSVRDENLSQYETSNFLLSACLTTMGFILGCTWVAFSLSEYSHMGSTVGMASGIMLLFTVSPILMGCWGMYLTKRRDVPGWVAFNYGGGLFFFVILPLLVLGIGSRTALSVSDDRLRGICAVGKNDTNDKSLRK